MRAEADDRDPRKIGGGRSACHTVTAGALRTAAWSGCLRKGVAAASLAVAGYAATAAHAEPVLDRALSGLQLITTPSCVVVKIEFNFRIRYVSHFPIGTGDELRVSIRPIDPGAGCGAGPAAARGVACARQRAVPPSRRSTSRPTSRAGRF